MKEQRRVKTELKKDDKISKIRRTRWYKFFNYMFNPNMIF